MEKPLLQLADPLVWNLALKGEFRATRVGGTRIPIPNQSFTSPTNLLWVGIGSEDALPTWYTAGWVAVRVPLARVDSGSNFIGDMEVYQTRIGLSRPKLMHWKAYEPTPYKGSIAFPKYFNHVYFEVYWYDGPDLASYGQKLDEINAKLDGGTGENSSPFF
jgi:hypothetical protein